MRQREIGIVCKWFIRSQRNRRNMWEPYEFPDSSIGYCSEKCLDHVHIIHELKRDKLKDWTLLSSYGMISKRPNVVRSLGWDPGYHEEIQNGPENKIHIRKVLFRGWRMVPVFSSEMF